MRVLPTGIRFTMLPRSCYPQVWTNTTTIVGKVSPDKNCKELRSVAFGEHSEGDDVRLNGIKT